MTAKETDKRPTIGELLTKRGESFNLNSAAAVAATEGKPEDEEVEKPETPEAEPDKKEDGDEKEAKPSKEDKAEAARVAALVELREKNRQLREELEGLKKDKDNGETSYYAEESSAETTAFDQQIHKLKEDRLTASWLNQKDKLGAEESTLMYDEFLKLCDAQENENPGINKNDKIYNIMMDQPDPGRFIVGYVSSIKDQEKYGTTPDEMREKIRAEVKAEVTKEVADGLGKKRKLTGQLPRDISGSRAASGDSDTYERPTAEQLYNRASRVRSK